MQRFGIKALEFTIVWFGDGSMIGKLFKGSVAPFNLIVRMVLLFA